MRHSLLALIAIAAAAMKASAFEFRTRWVQRIGNTDIVVPEGFSDAEQVRIRLQIGVFDDGAGPAPAGGLLGWNVGTINVSGSAANSIERRTPGRLAPFNFSPQDSANGSPPAPAGGDVDFQMLTDIDATLGVQTPFWGCAPAPGETPLPQPPAVIRGRNEFISVFEFTSDPNDNGFQEYEITVGGNVIAATEWREVGAPLPPDCGDPNDPNDNTPGQVVYAPFPTLPRSFTATIFHGIPAPGALALMGVGGLLARRRRAPGCMAIALTGREPVSH